MGRQGALSVGTTTDVSSLADQVRRFKPRVLAKPTAAVPAPSSTAPATRTRRVKLGSLPPAVIDPLVEKCIKVIVANFERLPVHESSAVGPAQTVIPPKFLARIAAGLPVDLNPTIGSLYVFDENYWKRRCVAALGWQRCQIVEHGLTWKQLFFEAHATRLLEEYDPAAEAGAAEALIAALKACQDHVFTLEARQLLGHPDMQTVALALPNLTAVHLTYGVRRIGMQYERLLFGMKISDAASLAKALQATTCLTSLVLQGNLLDDDLLRMLMTGLVRNGTVTALDVSHNRITSHGARLLSKLLGEKSVLVSLSAADNHIHADGGRHLGRALRANDSLTELDLRLNRLGDDGARVLLENLRENRALTTLGLGANSVGRDATSALAVLLREPGPPLACLNLNCNELDDEDVRLLRVAAGQNTTLTSLDLRRNRCAQDLPDLEVLEKISNANELALLQVTGGLPAA